MALFLIKIKEDVWINPEKITSIYYGKGYSDCCDDEVPTLTVYLADGNEYSFYNEEAKKIKDLLDDNEIFF